jgi:hypothetical protein
MQQATVIPFPPLLRLRSADAAAMPRRARPWARPPRPAGRRPGPASRRTSCSPSRCSSRPGPPTPGQHWRSCSPPSPSASSRPRARPCPASSRGRGGFLTGPGARAGGTTLFALGAAAVVGPGLATTLLVLLLVETCRHALAAGSDRSGVGAGLLAAGLLLRFDAGSVALGLEPAPELLAAGGLLALFLALAFRSAPPSPGRGRGGRDLCGIDLGLLALAAGVTALYAAALLGDPRITEAAGVWPLVTVPLVVAGLVRLWRAARTDAAAASRPARPLAGRHRRRLGGAAAPPAQGPERSGRGGRPRVAPFPGRGRWAKQARARGRRGGARVTTAALAGIRVLDLTRILAGPTAPSSWATSAPT